jgi:CDGSH-type Zn-finger protein
MAIKITPRDNGPYRVELTDGSEIQLFTPSGQPIDLPGTAFSLCRCGGSTKKPFCDGTHSKIGFQAAEAAVAATDQQK